MMNFGLNLLFIFPKNDLVLFYDNKITQDSTQVT
jgi:hypothetical protein